MNHLSSDTTIEPGGREAANLASTHASALGAPVGPPRKVHEERWSSAPSARAARGVMDAHVPGPRWEEGVPHASAPGVERLTVIAGERGESKERLDAPPLGLAGDPGAESPARLARCGAGPSFLRPDQDDAEEGAPLSLDVGGGFVLGPAELLKAPRPRPKGPFDGK